MKYLISILLIIIYVSNSNAADKKYDCDEVAKIYDTEWNVDDVNSLDEGTFLKNKTKFKDFSFNRISIYDTPLLGLQISFKNRFYNICFDSRTFPFGIIVEEIGNNLVFYVITNIGFNIVYSVSFDLKNTNKKPKLSFLSETNETPHYKWFVDKLTLKDAMKFHKSMNFEEWVELYWGGKWYHVEWYASDYN